jgi:hypothetical protein
MAFTYRLESSDTREVAIAQIRLEVGDQNSDRGIKPDGDNYSDEEIWHIYTALEGQLIGRAAARICEQQATAWSSVPRTMFGSLFDPRHVGRGFMARAKDLRRQYGTTTLGSTSFSVNVKRAGSNG